MKYKMAALILALTVAAWAQTTPTTPHQSTVPADKAKCACCDKMAPTDTKDAHASCARNMKASADGKDMGSCCGGKDAKSCMKGDKDKTASAQCGEKCSKQCEKGCCSKKNETTAKNCCASRLRS